MMTDMTDNQVDELASAAGTRAAFCAFLNLHFLTLVDEAFTTRLRNGELSAVLAAIGQDEAGDADLRAGATLMVDYLEKTRRQSLAQVTQELGVDRTRLYRGVSKGYGPAAPNEMSWTKSGEQFGTLQTLAGIYRQAGLEVSSEAKERLDYISVELSFLETLAQREAEAWAAGDPEAAGRLLVAQRDFVAQHLGAWVPDFVAAALEFAQTDFYRGHLIMLRGFLAREEQQLAALAQGLEG